jgi:hypothetical protein
MTMIVSLHEYDVEHRPFSGAYMYVIFIAFPKLDPFPSSDVSGQGFLPSGEIKRLAPSNGLSCIGSLHLYS